MENSCSTIEIYRGDIFYISPGSCVGSEQKCGRPGVIVSNNLANKYSPNVEVVLLTSSCRNIGESSIGSTLREHSNCV